VATELAGHNRPEVLGEMAKRFQGVTPLASEDIARAILYAVGQPAGASINEILIRPTSQGA
jgi:NADP-dependent 3-hydroxy acid dehydrogenase YdfG